ncbi:MAG: phosphoadenosine phosphosulfate reductase family protein [Lachnospiraceae bacterium]|nr:phosphoadenosine phosphosulfate reductase family protein [Lachnospiraceae bacterium]
MISYTCRNREKETEEPLPCTDTRCESSRCPVCGGRAEAVSEIYWCESCRVPLYEETCSLCGRRGKRLTTDIRPVFPEERLIIEIVMGKPFAYLKESIWNGTGNRYYVNGQKLPFSIGGLKERNKDEIRCRYDQLKGQNTDLYFKEYQERFVRANRARYERITEEAGDFIRQSAGDADIMDMFVSFSGGKDSTVTSDLVTRALSRPEIVHIFGDTTLEFPFTYEYIRRFRKEHPKTPLLTARNKEKDFQALCRMIGPPSRVMRWCCTVFKTGVIQKKIRSLFREKSQILTFYGIRRSESVSRNKYERESDSPKITKQRIVSPVIDWMDFDIWLYLFTREIDFNIAYRLGYARVGCWCCPNNSEWSEFLSSVHMQRQSEEFHSLLVEFAESIGKEDAENYVNEGGWKARQGGNGVAYARKSVVSFQPCVWEETAFNYELQRPISEELFELFRPFGYLDKHLGRASLGEVYVRNQKGEILLKLQGRIGSKELKVTIVNVHLAGAGDLKTAEERVKCQLTKYQMCMGCMACESVCRFNALSIKEQKDGAVKYSISEEKCRRCAECVNHFTAGCYMRKVLAIKRT